MVALAVTGCGLGATSDTATPGTAPASETEQTETEQTDTASEPLTIEVGPETDSSDGNSSDSDSSNTAGASHSIVAQATVAEVAVRASPDAAVDVVLANPTASGAPLVFRAVDGGATSPDWIEVFLPIQPNGSTGWVKRSDVALSSNPYRVEIDRATYSLRVFNLDEVWLEAPIAVGTGDTPTPVGDFYLLELLAPPDPAGAYGPYAFGLSGFSEVLTSFGGADTAIIGIHGTNDPTSLGSDVSHGCIRVDNAVIEQLATTLPLGTPVGIS